MSGPSTNQARHVAQIASGLHGTIAKSHPKLERGRVWCTECGRSQAVNPAECLRHGWPKCCGYTMTIDSPRERDGR